MTPNASDHPWLEAMTTLKQEDGTTPYLCLVCHAIVRKEEGDKDD